MIKYLVLASLCLPFLANAEEGYNPSTVRRLRHDLNTVRAELKSAERARDNTKIAQKAYLLAWTMAKISVDGYICDVELYQGDILTALAKATTRSPYIKNAARTNPELNKALAGSLSFHQLLSDNSAANFAANLENTVFENSNCGAICPTDTIEFKAGGVAVRAFNSYENDRNIMIPSVGTYTIAQTAEGYDVTVKIGSDVTVYKLIGEAGANGLITYTLDIPEVEGAHFVNGPSGECSA